MTTRQSPTSDRAGHATVRRRGILAAAGAVVAGIVAKQAAQPVAAAATMLIADTSAVVINTIHGQTNLTGDVPNGQTVLVADARSSGGNAFGFYGFGAGGYAGVGGGGTNNGIGVSGVATGSNGKGVAGSTDQGYAVYGEATGAGGFGVYGTSPSYPGVYGTSTTDVGTYGSSTGGDGVHGFSSTATGVSGNAPGTNGIGVYGTGTLHGVRGESSAGIGVYGRVTGAGSHGVRGDAGTAPGAAGVVGVASNANAVAFAGIVQSPAVWAGYFNGLTVVNGNFAVTGSKNAAVKDAAGNYRLMHCVEAPEAWFEDIGKAKLVTGKTDVRLDADFTALVHTDDYHVFLTSFDPGCKGLSVATHTASGFSVQELSGGTSSGTFSWRVVAKRADITGERFARFILPTVKMPDPVLPSPKPPLPPRP